MQLATTINSPETALTTAKRKSSMSKFTSSLMLLVAFGAIGLFASPELLAAVQNDELKPLADKAVGWSTNIAIIGCVLGLSFGFVKAATTNRWEPALMPIGLGVLWGVAFALVTVALGAPIAI